MIKPSPMAADIGASRVEQVRFAAMLEQHRGIVLKIAHTYCRTPDDQRDLVQDISMQLWRAFPAFDPECSRFSTWMYRIALNVAISQVRSYSRRQRHHVGLDEDAMAAVPDQSSATPEEEAGLRMLHTVIHRLDPLNRALMLLYLDGHSHREIAEILGTSPGNVATRIGRLKQRIREEMT